VDEISEVRERKGQRLVMNYIVFDLEATCWENDRTKKSEIIEIGACRLNDALEKTGEFQMFVQPVLNPKLSEFCAQLTGIRQEQVQNATKFPEVCRRFREWIGQEYWLCSWGFYDKRKLEQDCVLHKVPFEWVCRHISIKHQYADLRQDKPCGILRALADFKWKFEGRHHRGIDDARNITRVFRAIFPALWFEKS
jgi:3'-5' exoribonuclease 1